MTLPGKLTLGYLQEDNPQKFYFRVSPLMVKDETGCQPVETARQEYLEDGFIRIVPDKNEISHFKNRMRAMGRYCLLDLRRHAGENDKIRPNKNHSGENGDRNAFIVYSDVITAVPPLFMAETVTPDQDGLFPQPGTPLAAVVREGAVTGVYAWTERDGAACTVGDNLAGADLSGAAERLIPLRAEGLSVTILADLAQWGVKPVEIAPPERPAEPAAEAPRPAEVFERPADGSVHTGLLVVRLTDQEDLFHELALGPFPGIALAVEAAIAEVEAHVREDHEEVGGVGYHQEAPGPIGQEDLSDARHVARQDDGEEPQALALRRPGAPGFEDR